MPASVFDPLADHALRLIDEDLSALVRQPRDTRLTAGAAHIHLDARKQRLDGPALDALFALLEASGFSAWRDRLLTGAAVNETEARPALHPALRDPSRLTEQAVADALRAARSATREFAEACARPDVLNGHPVRRVVNIGIGGSDLGPRLVSDALKAFSREDVELRFVSNLDPADLDDALEGADPQTTLVCITSKSFTTQETLLNARAARYWLARRLGEAGADARLAAATANPQRAEAFGVAPDRIFAFADGVGGRYSLWSAAGLCLEIALEPNVFDRLLAGAAEMDRHFTEAPAEANLPVLKALIDVWNRVGLKRASRCVAVYSSRLERLAAYLQQLEMESLGKGVTRTGEPLADEACGALVWGGRGCDVQHSFFQWLHQGLDEAPVDFVGVEALARQDDPRAAALAANMVAQGAALLDGRIAEGEFAEHRSMPGGRASSTLLLDDLTPEALGALIALHEHKVFVESLIYGLNPYDQWGVELGKTLANAILSGDQDGFDPSTRALMARLQLGGSER
ncbi:MAG: glucose-6-phosphate isomerase [Pseudomonadota bacterium]